MDTKMPVFVVLSLAVAYLVILGSGYGALIGGTPADQSQSAEKLNNTSGGAPKQEGAVRGSQDSTILSMVISAGTAITDFLSFLAFLPSELDRLEPVPTWAARPIGRLLQIVGGLGLFQFTAGRIYQ